LFRLLPFKMKHLSRSHNVPILFPLFVLVCSFSTSYEVFAEDFSPTPNGGFEDPSPILPIDSAVEQLDLIIDDALRNADRIGYFTALYERITTNIRRSVVAGTVFQNSSRMSLFDLTFAQRFLDAWSQHQNAVTPSSCWQVAFDILNNSKPLAVQHIMLGMNAHINFDLGIATAQMARSPEGLKSLHDDYLILNEILWRFTNVMEVSLSEISPRLGKIIHVAPMLEAVMYDFGIFVAREWAWEMAVELVTEPENWDAIVARRDAQVTAIGKALFPLPGLLGKMEEWIREAESNDIRQNIVLLGQ